MRSVSAGRTFSRALFTVFIAASGLCGAADSHWVGTWGCAPQLTEDRNLPPAPGLANSTLRQIVRTSIGGKRVRLRFSNRFGTGPVTMKAVSLAESAGHGAIRPSSAKGIVFHGETSVAIPAGEAVTSDPFDYEILPLTEYAVTIAFGDMSNTVVTGHPGSRSTSYLKTGSAVDAETLPDAATTAHWYIVTGIDVLAEPAASAVVILGDSITDGRGSDTDGNNRWTDNLARRLLASPATQNVGVLNEGLGGNAVLTGGLGPPALTRLDRDLLGQSSARWLIVMEGVNDIGGGGHPETVAAELIAAYERFIATAHSHSIRAYGITILPFGGSMYDSPAREATRQAVNDWIRTSGKFDAVIDMDAAVRDPAASARLLPAYDSGDHLHPNVAGYQKMAEVIDLQLFR
jgi:lysophospholipase L1-like esterase